MPKVVSDAVCGDHFVDEGSLGDEIVVQTATVGRRRRRRRRGAVRRERVEVRCVDEIVGETRFENAGRLRLDFVRVVGVRL